MGAPEVYGSARSRLSDLLDGMDAEARADVMVLDRDENDAFESLSLRRFPHSGWSGIDWERCGFADQGFVRSESEAAELIRSWLRRLLADDSLLVVFWGNLAVPAVAMPVKIAIRYVEEILYTSDDFWLFAVDENILIEFTHEGTLTMGRIPESG